MRLFSAGALGRLRVPLALLLVPLAAGAAALNTLLMVIALLAALLLLLWELAAVERGMSRLAARLADDELDAKLEVGGGSWGQLCHAINRLLQQRRSQQRLQRLLAAPPAPLAARLGELSVPPDGLPCEVAVLGLTLPAAGDDPVERLRAAASIAARQAEAHGALLARSGDRLLLIFGALGESRPEMAMRAAQRAAYGLRDAWPLHSAGPRPLLSLAGGSARGLLLPSLGYTVLGPPIDEALALLDSARPAALICSERAYVSLRRGGAPISPAPRLSPAGSPAYAVPL